MSVFDELLELQNLDTAIDQLRHKIAHTPEAVAVAAAEAALAEVAAARSAVAAQRQAVAADERALEREIAEIDAKSSHVSDQLYGGSVSSPKELEALQHELDTLAGMKRDTEDREIEQMELAEPLDARLAELESEVTTATETLESARGALSVAVAELEVQLGSTESARTAQLESVPQDLFETYERIRRGSGGIGAAKLTAGRCEGCHLGLPAVELDEVRKAAPDAVVLCPECGRILVR